MNEREPHPTVSASLTGTTVYTDGDVKVTPPKSGTVNSTVLGVQLGVHNRRQRGCARQHRVRRSPSSISGGSIQAKNITVDAEGSPNSKCSSSSSASSSFVSGMSIDATATASPTVSRAWTGVQSLTASGDISVTAASANSMPSVVADGRAGQFQRGLRRECHRERHDREQQQRNVGAATITSTAGDVTYKLLQTSSTNSQLSNVTSNT